jgi:hypothetical protein
MREPWEPTDDEIAAWAYRPDAVEAVQDWDLAIVSVDRAPLLVRLATDPACPTRDYFLRVLYLLVGDRVRAAPGDGSSWEPVERVLRLAEAMPDARITRWVARARALAAHPEQFDYGAWCGGGLVDADSANP